MRPPLRGVCACARDGDARDAAGQGCLHSGGSQHGQHVATVRAALERAEDSRALLRAYQATQLLVGLPWFVSW